MLLQILTVGFTKSEFNLCAGGIFSLIPSFGGKLCVRRCVYRCGGSICLAGDRGYFRSSGKYVVILTKPVINLSFDCNGTRIRGSWIIFPNAISADPKGTAVWETFSRTSKTVKRTKEFLFRPSPERNIMVQIYCGFEHRCKKQW